MKNPREFSKDKLKLISSLRHCRNLLQTCISNLESVEVLELDRETKEGTNEAKQNIEKAFLAVENELIRYPIGENNGSTG